MSARAIVVQPAGRRGRDGSGWLVASAVCEANRARTKFPVMNGDQGSLGAPFKSGFCVRGISHLYIPQSIPVYVSW